MRANTLKRLSVKIHHAIYENTFWWRSFINWKKRNILPFLCVVRGHTGRFPEEHNKYFVTFEQRKENYTCSRCGHLYAIDVRLRDDQFLVPIDTEPVWTSTGKQFAQNIVGGNNPNSSLILKSTHHAKKGNFVPGNLVYDEQNQRLGIKTVALGDNDDEED